MFKLRFVLAAFFFCLLSACSEKKEMAPPSGEVKGQPIRREVANSNSTSQLSQALSVAKTNPASQTAVSSAPKPKAENSEYAVVSFEKLAGYTFNVPEGVVSGEDVGKSAQQIPAEVRAFDQKKVSITGFMLPLKVDNGLVTEMLVMKDQAMCCYGAVPRINDWVSVKLKEGVKSVMDQPVTLLGKLRVGEMLENGYVVGIYEMQGEKMELGN